VPKDTLICFDRVSYLAPRKMILQSYYSKKVLTEEIVFKLRRELKIVEENIFQLEHIKSIIEKSLLKE
jgi:hypothetical protein